MKKSILLIAALITMVSFSSCKREKTCQCVSDSDGTVVKNIVLQKAAKSQQETACDSYETSTTSCSLLKNSEAKNLDD